MSSFLELTHKGSSVLIGVGNIAMVEQLNQYEIKLTTLTKIEGEQLSYVLPLKYGDFHYRLFNTENGRLYDVAINTTK